MSIDDLIGHECAIAFQPTTPDDERGGYSYYHVHAIDHMARMICVTETVQGSGPVWLQLSDIVWAEVPKAACTDTEGEE